MVERPARDELAPRILGKKRSEASARTLGSALIGGDPRLDVGRGVGGGRSRDGDQSGAGE